MEHYLTAVELAQAYPGFEDVRLFWMYMLVALTLLAMAAMTKFLFTTPRKINVFLGRRGRRFTMTKEEREAYVKERIADAFTDAFMELEFRDEITKKEMYEYWAKIAHACGIYDLLPRKARSFYNDLLKRAIRARVIDHTEPLYATPKGFMLVEDFAAGRVNIADLELYHQPKTQGA